MRWKEAKLSTIMLINAQSKRVISPKDLNPQKFGFSITWSSVYVTSRDRISSLNVNPILSIKMTISPPERWSGRYYFFEREPETFIKMRIFPLEHWFRRCYLYMLKEVKLSTILLINACSLWSNGLMTCRYI